MYSKVRKVVVEETIVTGKRTQGSPEEHFSNFGK